MLHKRGAVLRLLPSGALDPAFGTGGIATIEPPPPNVGTTGEAMALDASGRIVIAGEVDDDVPAVMRLLPDGAPDPAFGERRHRPRPWRLLGAAAWWQGIALDGSSIVVAGNAVNTPPYGTGLDRQPVLARFSDSGVPDPTFASGGFLLLERPGITLTSPQSLAIDAAGRIVFGATYATTIAFPREVTQQVIRLVPSGALDTSVRERRRRRARRAAWPGVQPERARLGRTARDRRVGAGSAEGGHGRAADTGRPARPVLRDARSDRRAGRLRRVRHLRLPGRSAHLLHRRRAAAGSRTAGSIRPSTAAARSARPSAARP